MRFNLFDSSFSIRTIDCPERWDRTENEDRTRRKEKRKLIDENYWSHCRAHCTRKRIGLVLRRNLPFEKSDHFWRLEWVHVVVSMMVESSVELRGGLVFPSPWHETLVPFAYELPSWDLAVYRTQTVISFCCTSYYFLHGLRLLIGTCTSNPPNVTEGKKRKIEKSGQSNGTHAHKISIELD